MKKFFAVVLVVSLALFAAGASAQVEFVQPSATATIAVNATIQQSASILLSANSINFNVVDPSQATDGDKSVTITGKAAVAKGHGVFMTLWSSDLTGMNDGQVIPAASVLGKTTGAAGFTSLGYGAWNYDPIGFTAAQGNLKQDASTALSLQLAPVPNFVPDKYTGTVTVLLQVQ